MLSLTRDPFKLFCALLAAGLVAGCNGTGDEAVRVAVIGTAASPFEAGQHLPVAAQLLRTATSEGLVAFDEQGRVIPALADRWIVTDDGLSYIFRLRDGTWADGSPLTSESAAAALRQSLRAVRGTALAADLGDLDEVIVRAARVVELRLSRPHPDFLQLLAQPELGLVRKGKGTGPMRLVRDGNVGLLTPIRPGERGLPEIHDWDERARPLQLEAMAAGQAITAFQNGDAAIVLGGRLEDYPLARSVGIARGTVTLDPAPGLFGLTITHGDGFLGSPENRAALAMAIDREALAAAIDANGWTPTTRIVSPGMDGDPGTIGERWADLKLEERRSEAARRVARWRENATKPRPNLRIALPAGPGADILLARLAEDFAAIGIEVRRVRETADADLRLVDAVARYPRARWFLNQLACAARRGLCSAPADALAAQARLAADPAARSALWAEAEAELTAANVYIPLGGPLRWSLARRRTSGLAPNRWAIHPLMSLAMLPK